MGPPAGEPHGRPLGGRGIASAPLRDYSGGVPVLSVAAPRTDVNHWVDGGTSG